MEAERKRLSPKFRVKEEKGGRVYTFFCDLSGAVLWKSKPIKADTREEECELAWNEAKLNINSCRRCGRNVIDALYNVEKMECVSCSPWQKPPVFCSECGVKLGDDDLYCKRCGNRINEEGVDEDAEYTVMRN